MVSYIMPGRCDCATEKSTTEKGYDGTERPLESARLGLCRIHRAHCTWLGWNTASDRHAQRCLGVSRCSVVVQRCPVELIRSSITTRSIATLRTAADPEH